MFGPGGPSFRDLVVEGLSSTVRGYDHLAPKFDHTPFRTPDDLLDRVADHLRAGPPIHRLLDLCCGTGAVLRRFEPLYDEGVGVDFSPGMLAEAERRFAPKGKARFLLGDALAWEPDQPYDVVTCFGAFGHVLPPDQMRFLGVVSRALRPGGRFVYVTAPRPRPTQWTFWAAHSFNLAMHVRNALVPPPFVMFYMTFPLDESLERCRAAGLVPEVTPLGYPPRPDFVLVQAVRP